MKHLLALLVLSVSVGAFAQERVLLNSKSVKAKSSSAILVRTSQTPSVVEVEFQVPMANTFCAEPRSEYIRQTCFRNESVYRERQVCKDVVVSSSTPAPSTTPRGPRYNPGTTTPAPRTERVCSTTREYVGTRQVPYDCSYTRSWCARYATDVSSEADSVRLKFKNVPTLGGTEEENFLVVARQRMTDGENVEYDIKAVKTVEGREYEVKKKGILGYDSYVIEVK